MKLFTQHSISQTDECQADNSSSFRDEAPNISLDEDITVDPKVEEIQAKNSRIKELEKELEPANTMIRDYQNRASDPAPSHICNQLSRIVKSLYKSLHKNEKFSKGEGYASPYNRQIKYHLMATIRESHPKFGAKEIRTALYSRYANKKRSAKRRILWQ